MYAYLECERGIGEQEDVGSALASTIGLDSERMGCAKVLQRQCSQRKEEFESMEMLGLHCMERC